MSLASIAKSLEAGLNRRNIVRRRNQGWLPRLVPYAGYGSTTQVRILARALMAETNKRSAQFNLNFLQHRSTSGKNTTHAVRDFAELAITTGAEAQRGWRQFFTTQVGFLPVEVEINGKIIHTRTDRNGYIDLMVQNHDFTPGWHEVKITPIQGESVTAPVMIVSPDAHTGLVSDIDDTIIVTWLPRATLAIWNSFVKHTNTRQVVLGMSDLYRDLLQNDPHAPVFYLSTGAWNTYSTLLDFIRKYRFPIGPLLMTDWGPTPTGLFRSGQEHKKVQLRNLLIMFPNIDWYLVGDDGQHDPLIYDEIAREHPSRIKTIMLRELNPVEQLLSHGTTDAAKGVRKDADIERHGTPVIRGRDGFELAQNSRR